MSSRAVGPDGAPAFEYRTDAIVPPHLGGPVFGIAASVIDA